LQLSHIALEARGQLRQLTLERCHRFLAQPLREVATLHRSHEKHHAARQFMSHLRQGCRHIPRQGRILRPKAEKNQAQFYSIVSRDTVEQDFALKRQLFLCEQGYAYSIVDGEELGLQTT